MSQYEPGHFKDCEWITKPIEDGSAICRCHARVGQALFGMNCTMEPERRRDGRSEQWKRLMLGMWPDKKDAT